MNCEIWLWEVGFRVVYPYVNFFYLYNWNYLSGFFYFFIKTFVYYFVFFFLETVKVLLEENQSKFTLKIFFNPPPVARCDIITWINSHVVFRDPKNNYQSIDIIKKIVVIILRYLIWIGLHWKKKLNKLQIRCWLILRK